MKTLKAYYTIVYTLHISRIKQESIILGTLIINKYFLYLLDLRHMLFILKVIEYIDVDI